MLILASASPRRRQLLTEHGYDFIVEPAEVTEVVPAHLTVKEIVLWNARLKANAVARAHPDAVVLGVDTLVSCAGIIFGKPSDMPEAEAMLTCLNGRDHEVFTGFCLVQHLPARESVSVVVTRVHFRNLTADARRAYLARIGPLDKAGAYAAQDDNGEMISRVEGSFSNVIGLPMEALGKALSEFGISKKINP